MLATMNYPPGYSATATRSCHRPPAKATSRPKPRSSQSQPLDPDELMRRLHIVVAERKAHSESKKRAMSRTDRKDKDKDKDEALSTAAKDKPPTSPTRNGKANHERTGEPQSFKLGQGEVKTSTGPGTRGREGIDSSSYRHIPQVAASQFARTTTVESPTRRLLVHKLSKKAMKFHMEGPNANPEISAAGLDTSPLEQARALRRAQGMRERQYGRNKVDHVPTLMATAELDDAQTRVPSSRNLRDTLSRQRDGP